MFPFLCIEPRQACRPVCIYCLQRRTCLICSIVVLVGWGSSGSLVQILGGQWHRRQDMGTSRRRSLVQVPLIHYRNIGEQGLPGSSTISGNDVKNHPTLMGQDTRDWHCQSVSHQQSSPCQLSADGGKTAQMTGRARAWAVAHIVWPN